MDDGRDALDAEMRRFVVETEGFYPPDVACWTVEEQRGAYDRMAAHFRAPRPAGLTVRDETSPGPAGPVPVRRYQPGAALRSAARVVYFHGGGCVLGGLDSHDDVCADLAHRLGLEVVSVDYRLAPEHPHPAAFDDALAVAEAEARARPVILAGDSVGGGLAAGAALALRGSARVLGQALIYPSLGGEALDLPAYRAQAVAPLLTTEDLRAYQALRAAGAPPWSDWRFAPLSATDVSGAAPAAAFAAALDPLRDDGAAWVDRLRAANVPARSEIAEGLCHGCLRARRRSGRAAAFFDRICDAIAEFARM